MTNISTPYFAYIKIVLFDTKGNKFDLGSVPPTSIESMECTRYSTGSSNKLIATFFDETAMVIEYRLTTGCNYMQVSYGYTNGAKSQTYNYVVSQYDLEFQVQGCTLSLEAYPTAVVASASNTSAKTYTGYSISDIVKQVFNDEGWSYTNDSIEPTVKSSTELSFTRTAEMTSATFINTILIPEAKSASTGDSDYQFNVTDTAENESAAAYFYSSSYPASHSSVGTVHDYKFQWGIGAGAENSTVLNFKPDFLGVASTYYGSDAVVANYVGNKTNQILTSIYDTTSNTSKTLLGNKNLFQNNKVSVNVGGSSYSESDMANIAAYMWDKHKSVSIQATLTIVGDPTLTVLDKISILILNKNGLPHHTSGTYLIISITDSISNGEFTTTLKLRRDGLNVGASDAVGNLANGSSVEASSTGSDISSVGEYAGALSGIGNTDIVEVAKSQLGNNESDGSADKYVTNGSTSKATPWCAYFTTWCAREASISEAILPSNSAASGFWNFFQSNNILHLGKYYGGASYSPNPGDIAMFSQAHSTSSIHHVGIVVSSTSSDFTYISGNSGSNGEVKQSTLKYNNPYVAGFGSPLYQNSYSSTSDFTKYSTNEETIYHYLISIGFNTAQACGALANIYKESAFTPSASNGSHYGICQWGGGRLTSLQNFCKDRSYLASSIEGQCKFMGFELQTSKSSTTSKMKTCANTADGCYNAGYNWCYYFEIPATDPSKLDSISKSRGSLAKSTYWTKYN